MLYFSPRFGKGDACPADQICIFKELRMAFGRRRGPSLETGTLQPWPIRSSLSSKMGGKSVMRGPDVCDEKVRGQIAEVKTPAASHVSKTARRGAPGAKTLGQNGLEFFKHF
jgi:hypothetical protein